MAALDKISAPALPPGSCLVCNRAMDPLGFFDLGVSIAHHGAAYLCGTCAVEIARKMRWSPPELLSTEKRSVWELRGQLRAEQEHSGELELALSSRFLDLMDRVTTARLGKELEGEPDGRGAAVDAGGGSDGGGGSPGRRRRGRASGAGDRAPAGPGAGDLGGRAEPDSAAAAGQGSGDAGGAAGHSASAAAAG